MSTGPALPTPAAFARRDDAPDGDSPAEAAPVDRAAAAAMAIVVVIGWVGILHINRWHIGPPVLFLWMGWLGVVLAARYLWSAAMSAASDGAMSEEEFWRPVGHAGELEREKRSLLKAIKEVEFDLQMGKMSEADAKAITQHYRRRAIDIIKALEARGAPEELSVREQIEREVAARLKVAGVTAKARQRSKAMAAAASADADSKGGAARKADADGAARPGEMSRAEAASPRGADDPGDSGGSAPDADASIHDGAGDAHTKEQS